MLRSALPGPGEPAAELEPLGCRERQHGLGQIRLQPIEHGLSQSHWQTPYPAFNDPTDRISFAPDRLDPLDHGLRGRPMRATHGGRLHVGQRRERRDRVRRHHKIVNLCDERPDLDTRRSGRTSPYRQNFASNRTRSNPSDRLPGRAATAAIRIPQAVLHVVRVVSVGGSELVGHLTVGAGSLVGIAHPKRKGGAGRSTLVHSRKYLHCIGFLTWSHDVTLPRPAPIELGLDFFRRDRQAGWTPVDDHSNARSVAFSPGADRKKFSEAVRHRSQKPCR